MGKHILIWLCALLAMVLIIPVFASPSAIWGAIQKEAAMMSSTFGLEDAETIVRKAGAVHHTIFVQSGIEGALKSMSSSPEQQRNAIPGTGQMLAHATNSYIEALGAMIFGVAMRIVIMFSWLPYVVPFLLAAVGEGYARRKIKFATFGQYGVLVYAGSAHAIIVLMMVPLLYLIVPFAMPPIFMPFWALVAALPIAVMIANASQILPK